MEDLIFTNKNSSIDKLSNDIKVNRVILQANYWVKLAKFKNI